MNRFQKIAHEIVAVYSKNVVEKELKELTEEHNLVYKDVEKFVNLFNSISEEFESLNTNDEKDVKEKVSELAEKSKKLQAISQGLKVSISGLEHLFKKLKIKST